MIKVPTEAQNLRAGDQVEAQGLVIAAAPGFAKTKVTFKGSEIRNYPNTQLVNVLVPELPSLLPTATEV